MKKRRLNTLANKLDRVPRKRFNMATWLDIWPVGGKLKKAIEALTAKKEPVCGTSACALGWGCTIPSFVRDGLHFNRSGMPTYNRKFGTEAAAAFFDIDYISAHRLFTGPPVTPKQKARQIRHFIKTGEVRAP